MLQTASRSKKSTSKKAAPHERFLEAFRWMLLARTLEEKLVSLYRGGAITGGVYIGKGQEAVSVACGLFLQKGDIFAPLIRDQAGRSAFGEPLVDVARTYLGSRQGPMRGRDGNIHRGRPRDGQFAMISHLGAMISVTVGALMAKRFKGEKNFIGLTCIGEGGMQTGSAHEGLNIAAVEQVPLVVVATNNHYAYSTPNEREFACHDLVDRAKGYGFEGHTIDGTDLASYVTDEIKREPFARDCLKCTEKTIVDLNLAGTETLREWREDAAAQVDRAISTAQKEAAPEADEEDWRALSMRALVDQVELPSLTSKRFVK